MKKSPSRDAWYKWMEITRTVDDARGLALMADCDCAESICDTAQKDNARRALVSVISGLMEKVHGLLPEIEPNLHGVINRRDA